MKRSGPAFKTALSALVMALVASQTAAAEDPCANQKQRAVVMSGGGAKGAFEAGAIYHLVVQRHCDFHEFSGSSVGALNGTFLAQAQRSGDPGESLRNMAAQAEQLVSLWQSLKSSNDIRKPRRLAALRFGLYGLDSMNDMEPLRELLDRNISIQKLSTGRPVRVGVVSFWSGEYREIVVPSARLNLGENFLDYVYASSVLPVYGRLPRIPDGSYSHDPTLWPQFTDGSLRHITPLSSYFKACKEQDQNLEVRHQSCSESVAVPPHEKVEQLFIIVTSPYSRDSESLPLGDVKCCRTGTHQMTDGRKIVGRTLALMDDAVYRSDLDFALTANEIVAWRRQLYVRLVLGTRAEQIAETKQRFDSGYAFAIESYNLDEQDRSGPSRPYEIGLVIPHKEFADPDRLLELSPAGIQDQLYCGCVAADEMMSNAFGQPSLSQRCAERFPALQRRLKKTPAPPTSRGPGLCGANIADPMSAEVSSMR
jgi:predicted acylesterase/phospholipase RssA